MSSKQAKLAQFLQAHLEHAVESRDHLLRVLIDEREKQSISRFAAERELTHQAFESIQETMHKGEVAMETRFHSVNELRGALFDAQANFPQRAEVDAKLASQEAKSSATDKQLTALQLITAGLVTQTQHSDLQAQIAVLRDAQNQGTGKERQVAVSAQGNQWVTGLLVMGGIAFAGLLISVTNMLIASGTVK